MYDRLLQKKITSLAGQYPVVIVTGPRQSGKTTLVRLCFPDRAYVNLEEPDNRDFAQTDPRGFLHQYSDGVVIDEIQRAPDLPSYMQTIVDKENKSGMYILTGSQQFLMLEKVSQSLAGRTAFLTLLPFNIEELKRNRIVPHDLDSLLNMGFYPRIYDMKLNPSEWYGGYVSTYLERDVRLIKNIGDLSVLQRFLQLCAARSGQILNYSEIGNACGINHNTVKSWISVLEASYIIFLLKPYHRNFNKRLVKSPKIYFYDSGLLCYLLNIRNPAVIINSPYRGHIFETLIIGEIVKFFRNIGELPPIYFWRDKTGNEIDCIIELNNQIKAIEIKSGATIISDFFKNLNYWNKISSTSSSDFLIYGGEKKQNRNMVSVLPWDNLEIVFKDLASL